MSNTRTFVWYVYRSYTPYTFGVMLVGKEERKKKERKKNKIESFVFDFLNCEEKSWDSGTMFYIRIAKRFHLHV